MQENNPKKTLKDDIKKLIKEFRDNDVSNTALKLFEKLGYNTERQNRLQERTFKTFTSSYIHSDSKFDETKALVAEWKSVDLLFQLSKDEISDQKSLFDNKKVDNTIIETYLFFAIELSQAEYSRATLAKITREVNKVFPMPVMILFKHGDNLTLSLINRRLHKKDEHKDVLEKVTLIKDISITAPHRAHIEILFDLSFEELKRVQKFTNFVELHNAWQKTLDTKELNKRFYRELSNWYFWAISKVNFPPYASKNDGSLKEKRHEHNAKSLIRLLTRVLFIWFMKEKGLVSELLFDEIFIREKLIKNFSPNNNSATPEGHTYYKVILQNLFFATLNQTRSERRFRDKGKNMNVTNLMRYEEFFINSETFLSLVDSVPFMNGGLFDCLDKPDPTKRGKMGGDVIIYEDGFSDRSDSQLNVPDYIFFGLDKHADLRSELGDDSKQRDIEVNGLFTILKSYKFTVTENTPIEEDIALDPELLGLVFENLLASHNEETKTTARKQTGSFYTPREIVNYMVDESLKAYFLQKLDTDAGMKKEDAEVGLDLLLGYNEKDHLFNSKETAVLIDAIDSCKIIDPACGSGAFPMGILHKLVHILHKLDPDNAKWREVQKQKAIEETSEAFNIGDISTHDSRLKEISNIFESNSADYGRKLFLIENCIYGVDIQPIAIQISKLRFFISLVVDQKIDKLNDNFGILPLPNLETKFVTANTLIEIEKQKKQGILFENPRIKELEEALKDIRHMLFTSKTPSQKRNLREKDKEIREEIANLLNQDGYDNASARMLASWDPYDQNASSPFFDPEWMFGITDGFEIVIGNPPYLRVQSLSEKDKKNYAVSFKSAVGSYDLYVLFTEKGLNLLSSQGILNFIQPDKWVNGGLGKGLRKITAYNIAKLISFKHYQVFNASTYSSLLWMTKKQQVEMYYAKLDKDLPDNDDLKNWLESLNASSFTGVKNESLVKSDVWNFAVGENSNVMQRLLEQKQTLGDITSKIFQGIATSADKIYVLPIIEDKGDTVRCFSKQLDREVEVEKGLTRPFLMGKDVHRYQPSTPKNVVIFPYVIVQNKVNLMTSEVIRKKYPLGWAYLQENIDYLKSRENGRFVENWWCFSRPQNMSEFLSIKIMTPDICGKPEMTIDETATLYHTTTLYSFVFNDRANGSEKFYLSLLNSKVMWYFQTITGNVLQGGFLRFKTEYLKPFPIPTATETQKKGIEKLVDYILYIKSQPFYASTDLNYAEERLMANFFENFIDALVYELYFPEELHEADKQFLSLLIKENLPDLNTIQGDKIKALKEIVRRLSHKDHPLYKNLFFLDSVPVIRTIQGKA